MPSPAVVEKELEFFPEVKTAVIDYMPDTDCTFDVVIDQALRVLGKVDALLLSGLVVYHFPGYAGQVDIQVFQPIFGEKIDLKKVGKQFSGQTINVKVHLSERSCHTLHTYIKTCAVSEPLALTRAVFLFLVCRQGNLWVKEMGTYKQIVLD